VEAKEGEGEVREGKEGGRKRERAKTVICAIAGLGYGY
jgi:hypothetical protein